MMNPNFTVTNKLLYLFEINQQTKTMLPTIAAISNLFVTDSFAFLG